MKGQWAKTLRSRQLSSSELQLGILILDKTTAGLHEIAKALEGIGGTLACRDKSYQPSFKGNSGGLLDFMRRWFTMS